MKKIINLPHAVYESTCYVNGLYDLLTWKGAEYSYFLLPVIGGSASFTYLKFKMATPPCMVYWGPRTSDLLKYLSDIISYKIILSENKSFKKEFPKIKVHIDKNTPALAGALDMFYLPYYSEIYKKEHIPIHYVLIVGYDDEKETVFVHDCTYPGLQEIPYTEFEPALSINVPGLSKKNTYRIFELPDKMPSELEVAEKGFAFKANRMLNPPVKMFGIPAMRRVVEDIKTWTDEGCFKHMVAYAGMTPPLIADNLSHNDGMRYREADLFSEMGTKYKKNNWMEASKLFRESGELIIRLSAEGLKMNGSACSKTLAEIADLEEKAFHLLI